MSVTLDTAAQPRGGALRLGWAAWVLLLISAVVMMQAPTIFGALGKTPKVAVLPLTRWIGAAMKWGVEYLTPFTRALGAAIDVPLQFAFALFAKGFVINGQDVIFPRLSWLGLIGAVALAGYAYGGRRTAVIGFACFAYIALFGQWDSAMLTLALVAICVPFGVALGIVAGIAAHRWPRLDAWLIRPALDLAQTVPAFAYLVPILLLFGSGPVPALVATVIFAAPPMVRATTLALSQVPEEIQSFADMTGCTRGQKLWRVMLPTARPLLMVGVNQVIMMTLNMVIISSMIGAGGLGYDVLLALRQLDIGKGLEAGLAIVALAIALDRISAAAAQQKPDLLPPGTPFLRRHPLLAAGIAWLALTTLLSLYFGGLAAIPKTWTVTTGPFFSDLVAWINVNFFDSIEAVRTWLLLNVLNPVKIFLQQLPWSIFLAAATLLGWQLGGWRLALLAFLLIGFCAATGQWEKSMTSVYLCSISAAIAAMIGVPLGVWGARSPAANRILTVAVDTLQTLPAFVYLIPVIMLFQVGAVTAMIAIILFAVTPAIRYTTHGIRQTPPHLLEAGTAMGCTPRQTFWRVQLPLALPEIMLGLNQTVLLALSMLVITALVGTSDLGQEVYIGLTKADGGRAIVAGLCIAFLGIVADRLIVGGARRMRRRLGLPED